MNDGYDRGFEDGAVAAAKFIFAYLTRTGQVDAANQAAAAWHDGSLVAMATGTPEPAFSGAAGAENARSLTASATMQATLLHGESVTGQSEREGALLQRQPQT